MAEIVSLKKILGAINFAYLHELALFICAGLKTRKYVPAYMCGIVGVFGDNNCFELVKLGLKIMHNRGRDGCGVTDLNSIKFSVAGDDCHVHLPDFRGENCLGHCLHAVVNKVLQPLQAGESYLAANCEVYNWTELCNEYGISAKNDADLVFKMLEKYGLKKTLSVIDGDYAFAWYNSGKVFLARDILGIKPMFFYFDGAKFYFASEKKVLRAFGINHPIELCPRKVLEFDINQRKLIDTDRTFFKTVPKVVSSRDEIIKRLGSLIEKSIRKRIPDQNNPATKKFGILFSGGVDSTVLAYLCKKMGYEFTCYTAAVDDPAFASAKDLVAARNVAHQLGFDLRVAKIKLCKVEGYLKKVCPLIESNNVVKAGVALPLYLACELARKDGIKVIFSGLGSEEIFAGYERHLRALGVHGINDECLSGLLQIHERDLYRDDVLSMDNLIEVRLPFLDKDLVSYALRVPEQYKISPEQKKIILREAAVYMGIDKEIAFRPKLAAQYGSKFDRAISKLAKLAGYESKSAFLRNFYSEPEFRIGALVSGGKDGLYAAYVMHRQNYEIACFITVDSENPASYMFHTPNVSMVRFQSEAAGIPLFFGKTAGREESELDDLYNILVKAKVKYNLDGVVVGALFSAYQRNRIEMVCDRAGLRVFAPLWHKEQGEYMHELMQNRFRFIICAVAAEGFDVSWLGREVLQRDVELLEGMGKKYKINIAGEGGEYETFVIDCPLFKRKIRVLEGHTVMESGCAGQFIIDKAVLEDK